MQVGKKTRMLNIICVILVFMAGALRLLGTKNGFLYNCLIFALFSAAASIWIFQLQRRLVQQEVRRNLIAAALLMIFWMAVRTIKYEFLPSGHFAARYIWYLYYVPMLLIPLLMFFSVLAVGKPHDTSIDRRWYLLFIPITVIIAGVLTNDIHQMAFSFPSGLTNWNDYKVNRGFVYYAAMISVAVLVVAVLAVVFSRCAVPEKRKMIWVPLLPLLVGMGYIVCAAAGIRNLSTKLLTEPEMGCFIFAAFMESLICVRLFPCNDNYGLFWRASSIGAGIMDKEGVVRYKSENTVSVTLGQVKEAQNNAVLLENGKLSLKSHAVRSGYGYWIRDITEIKKLNEELEELGNVTAEENSIIEAENKMRAERLHIEKQNRLYGDMARGVEKQLDILNGILDSPPEDEEEFEKIMRYACVLNSYIKRHSNLLLLSYQSDSVYSEELRCAAAESMEYVKLCGIKTHCIFEGKEMLSGKSAVAAYEMFEDILEASIPVTDNILVYWKISPGKLMLQIEINIPGGNFPDIVMSEKASALGGALEFESEDSTNYITFTLPTGGGEI